MYIYTCVTFSYICKTGEKGNITGTFRAYALPKPFKPDGSIGLPCRDTKWCFCSYIWRKHGESCWRPQTVHVHLFFSHIFLNFLLDDQIISQKAFMFCFFGFQILRIQENDPSRQKDSCGVDRSVQQWNTDLGWILFVGEGNPRRSHGEPN